MIALNSKSTVFFSTIVLVICPLCKIQAIHKPMYKIGVLSASVRDNRNSHRVALYFNTLIPELKLGEVTLIDLAEYDFPVFHERLKYIEKPSATMLDFASKITEVEGVIIVTPEYNGGYPAALKNAVDLLYEEWHRKPIAISTCSDGSFGGTQVITSLQFTLWKMKSWTVPAMFPVPKVEETFDIQGHPSDRQGTDKRARRFLDELIWCMEANRRMNSNKKV
jgi:NAD(P)H-dependent FMN reductase